MPSKTVNWVVGESTKAFDPSSVVKVAQKMHGYSFVTTQALIRTSIPRTLSIKIQANNLGKINPFIWNQVHEHVCNAIEV